LITLNYKVQGDGSALEGRYLFKSFKRTIIKGRIAVLIMIVIVVKSFMLQNVCTETE